MIRISAFIVLLMVASVHTHAQADTPGSVGDAFRADSATPNPQAEEPATGDNATDQRGGTANTTDVGTKDAANSEYDKKAFEVLTGVGAVLAGVQSTSYKIDTNSSALSQTNVGRKTVEILLGGGFIMPWHKGGGWIEKSYCRTPPKERGDADSGSCRKGGDAAYKNYRPWETFLSIRFAPATEQAINGFVVGGGYRITKYFSLLVGYSVTPVDEPSPGFRVAASQVVAANPNIFPYNQYNAASLLSAKPGAFDGFPLFLYDANGVTTTKIFQTSPIVTHYRSGIYFGVGIPLNFTALFKPSGAQ
jgi:hypothetical protein